MQLKMVALTRKQNGAYVARKAIPADVRESHFKLYGSRYETKFYASAQTPPDVAKQLFAEWYAQREERIAALRRPAGGDGKHLSHKEAHALAGEWYGWFIGQFEEEPGRADAWDTALSLFADASYRFVPSDLPPDEIDEFIDGDEQTQAHLGAIACDWGRVSQFLADKGIVLSAGARQRLAAAIVTEYVAAVTLLRKRANGDYTRDQRPGRFPIPSDVRPAGMTCWQLFEAWVKERKPKPATVDRRRGVFLHMQNHFGMRDVATITELEAVAWKDTLVTPERTGCTVNDVWLGAAKSIFNWGVVNKKLRQNPFAGLKVAYAPPSRNREHGPAFTPKEAHTILAASLCDPPKRLSKHHKAARRWVAWICAYSGMRVQEATQLRGDDIVQVDGIWAFRIRPEAGTQKKNRARTIPIHQHLIEQGLVEFARAHGSQPMFYGAAAQAAQRSSDPTNPQKPLAVKTREHLAAWVREIGVDDPELQPNHAWRHLFKQIGDSCGIPEKISDAITDHASANVARRYGRVQLDVMARELAKFPRFAISGA